jgi:alkylation response protein AidB-like acyl-CoA dehydrogenase
VLAEAVSRAPPSSASEWRERARALAEAYVTPIAEEIDRTDRVPESTVRRLADEGFLGLGVPREWDGSGGDARALVAVLEELSHASATVAVGVAVHVSVCALPILQHGTDLQKERYLRPLARGELLGAFALTEPGAGSDTARIATRYARDGAGFLLNGTKMFISNAVPGGLGLVFATSDPALGHRGISAFILPMGSPGCSIAQRLDKLGLRGSETSELVLDQVRLPSENLLGPEGAGLRVALGALTGGRVGIASCALGVAQAAFDEMLRHVRAHDEDWMRGRLARAYAELSSARTLVERAAERKDLGAPFLREASVAKLVASRAAMSIASAAVDVAGPGGVRAGAAAERLLRDARVFPIVEGTTEIQELILARSLLEGDSSPNL